MRGLGSVQTTGEDKDTPVVSGSPRSVEPVLEGTVSRDTQFPLLSQGRYWDS